MEEKKIVSSYDVEVKYINSDNYKGKGYANNSRDSLHLLFEYYPFHGMDSLITDSSKDSIVFTVLRNDITHIIKRYSKKELYEEEPGYFNCGPISSINYIGIRINNGNIAFVEIDTSRHVLRVKYDESKKILSTEFLNSIPYYR